MSPHRPFRWGFASCWACLAALGNTADAAAVEITPAPLAKLGMGSRISPQQSTADFLFEVTGGATFYIGKMREAQPKLHIAPEVGYSGDTENLHTFITSCGVGFGTQFFAVSYQLGFLVGTFGPIGNADPAIGIRNTGALRLYYDLFRLELGHELIDRLGDPRNDGSNDYFMVMASLDAGALMPIIRAALR